jgi:hypothetical protein
MGPTAEATDLNLLIARERCQDTGRWPEDGDARRKDG